MEYKDLVELATGIIEKEVEQISGEFDEIRQEPEKWLDKWVEFEVATAVRSANYTLVPVDFYERIAKAVVSGILGRMK